MSIDRLRQAFFLSSVCTQTSLLPHVFVCLYDLSVGSCDPYLYEHVMYGSPEPLNKVL